MYEPRVVVAVVFLVLAICSMPAAVIAKYGKKNRKWTTIIAFSGVACTLVFMILIWPYLPD